MDLELAEPAAEFYMPLIRKLLPAKDDHDVVVECALDLPERRIVDVPRQIKDDFGPASRIAFLDR
jgi:hypothetical protein